jgi:hypothetical protein
LWKKENWNCPCRKGRKARISGSGQGPEKKRGERPLNKFIGKLAVFGRIFGAKRQKPGFPLQVLGFANANPVGFPLQSLAPRSGSAESEFTAKSKKLNRFLFFARRSLQTTPGLEARLQPCNIKIMPQN